MHKKVLILYIIFNLLICSIKSQTITNVIAKQDGNNVVITYNLQCEGNADISLSMSEDGGSTFKGPLKSVNGDIGVRVKPGNKTIIWNVLQDQALLFGDNIVFRVIVISKFGKFTDSRDGKTYKTVEIGNQTWMAENLAYKATGGCWAYDNSESNVAIYGYLYDWETAKNACPQGWHLPSDSEWTILTNYLGGESVAGGKLKDVGKSYWKSPNTGASNETGFTALPGGFRSNNGKFSIIGGSGLWWSSSEYSTLNVWYRYVGVDNSNINRFSFGKDYGFSVRCVKDK